MLRTIHDTSRRLAAAALLLTALSAHAAAQVSTDPDNPTPMASSVVTGKSNGKAKTVYYSFTATAADPGEVKVKVTASTDERSTNLRVNFLDEDGQKVMDELYVIPNRDPATKVARHTFADRQKVIMRVTLPDDPQVKLLNYKIDVSGAVEFEQPAPDPSAMTGGTPTTVTDAGTTTTAADPSAQTTDPSVTGAEQTGQTTGDASAGGQGQGTKSVKQKVKDGVKKAGKNALKDVFKDDPF